MQNNLPLFDRLCLMKYKLLSSKITTTIEMADEEWVTSFLGYCPITHKAFFLLLCDTHSQGVEHPSSIGFPQNVQNWSGWATSEEPCSVVGYSSTLGSRMKPRPSLRFINKGYRFITQMEYSPARSSVAASSSAWHIPPAQASCRTPSVDKINALLKHIRFW